jgi:hypothetical protein
MNVDPRRANASDLARDLEWLSATLELRLGAYFAEPSTSPLLPDEGPAPPVLEEPYSAYVDFLIRNEITATERLIIVLALVPHLQPQLLDVLLTRNEHTQRTFSEFGGVAHAGNHFLPSIETALFLVAGVDLCERLKLLHAFESGERLVKLDVLLPSTMVPGEPQAQAALRLSPRFVALATLAHEYIPQFDDHFPARRVTTEMQWEELVLADSTLAQLEEIRHWVEHGQTLLHEWGMGHRLRPGFTSLFFGPAGTGKTLSACLLGKRCGCEVYKIDLSMVVSKYIGETEKNLARVFDQAQSRRWILFFDEADALFGKRTQVSDSHDRYANQEVSFLLQRIEDFDGVVILASNFKGNIDDAFLRRFQSVIHFQMPRVPERLRLWREAFPPQIHLEPALDLAKIAERYELSGGIIMNVSRFAALRALSRGQSMIYAADVEEGIRCELTKEGRAF